MTGWWVAVAVVAGCEGGALGSDPISRGLADLLSARDPAAFDAALQAHGRVRPDEVATISRYVETGSSRQSRNAARLLTIANSPAADAEIRKRIGETRDVGEWAIEITAVLDAPDGKALAGSRKDMVEAAVASTDADVRTAGLAAGTVAGDPVALSKVGAALSDPDYHVREAAAGALAKGDPTPYAARLREMLASESDPGVHKDVVDACARATDTDTITATQAAFLATPRAQQGDWTWAFSHSTAPWVRPFLADVARSHPEQRSTALYVLTASPDAAAVAACVSVFESPPTGDDLATSFWKIDHEPCEKMLGGLAGHPVHGDEALAVAQKWLADHP